MTIHKHLARLERVWVDSPIFFITTCTADRRRALAIDEFHAICLQVWRACERHYGWIVGRYVLMPNHVHFFCAPRRDDRGLEWMVGKWKEWTVKYAQRTLGVSMPLWQEEFFDHLLRSSESYEDKWTYVRQNPVRAGLVARAEDWPYQGELHELRYD
jgi:REP element-mobilizing transposase RayT